MSHIGIIGAGIAGLHLGIALRRQGNTATIYADRSADELTQGRMLNTVMHHHVTLERERALEIDHWDPETDGWLRRYQYVGGASPIRYSAALVAPSLAIDYRVYLPTLMKDFEELGGHLVVRHVHVDEADRLAQAHDLLVVATGRGGMSLLFPIREDLPPIGVKRRICAVITEGVRRPEIDGALLSVAPGVGEMIEIPILTAEGRTTALLFESITGGDTAARLSASVQQDLESLRASILQVLGDSFPDTAARVDTQAFAIRGPRDVLAGEVAPAMRQGSTWLPSGKLAVAIGDAHVLVDPLMGQGANIAALSAAKLADAFSADLAYDEQFRRRLELARGPMLQAAYEWTNLQLENPGYLSLIHRAAATNAPLASDFLARHSSPMRMWQVLETEERAANYLRQFGEEPNPPKDGK